MFGSAVGIGQSYETVTVTAKDQNGSPIVGASVSMVITKMVVKSDPFTKTSQKVPQDETLVAHTNAGGMAVLRVPVAYAEGIKSVTIRKPGHQTITAEVEPKSTPPFTVTMKRLGSAINWPLTVGISAGVLGLIWIVGRMGK
jgi:hypothetical protein